MPFLNTSYLLCDYRHNIALYFRGKNWIFRFADPVLFGHSDPGEKKTFFSHIYVIDEEINKYKDF